ncbi:MAG: family 16 glycosylhydrolase [Ferruginibacter sp.]|nr:family 16 glycosylhydrolase [Ferruginibacter sp.]
MKFTQLCIRFFTLVIVFISCKKSDNNGGTTPQPTLPVLTIVDASTIRTTTNTSLFFYVSLSKASSSNVSVDYTLTDGSATAPQDYSAASGTITIPANQLNSSIEVVIKGNAANLRQPNLEFTIALSNPKFCTLNTSSAKGTIITEDGTYLPTDNTGYTTPLTYPGKTLVWSDEFNASSLNLSHWNQEIGNGTGGWGNNELEYYTNSTKNTFLSNGNLIIEARKESIGGFNYSSGRLTTQGKKEFTFGRIDIRAKLPVAKGMWPALWMLGSNINSVSWPACGEIDIMELVGTYPNRTHGTMHWKPVSGTNTSKGGSMDLTSGNFSQQFHVFSIEWQQDTIKWYLDDQLFLTNTKADVGAANYPFNLADFFIFNVAVGGNWPGSPDATTSFPQRMFVDYVRVFQ